MWMIQSFVLVLYIWPKDARTTNMLYQPDYSAKQSAYLWVKLMMEQVYTTSNNAQKWDNMDNLSSTGGHMPISITDRA